jgi:hypothetical protein
MTTNYHFYCLSGMQGRLIESIKVNIINKEIDNIDEITFKDETLLNFVPNVQGIDKEKYLKDILNSYTKNIAIKLGNQSLDNCKIFSNNANNQYSSLYKSGNPTRPLQFIHDSNSVSNFLYVCFCKEMNTLLTLNNGFLESLFNLVGLTQKEIMKNSKFNKKLQRFDKTENLTKADFDSIKIKQNINSGKKQQVSLELDIYSYIQLIDTVIFLLDIARKEKYTFQNMNEIVEYQDTFFEPNKQYIKEHLLSNETEEYIDLITNRLFVFSQIFSNNMYGTFREYASPFILPPTELVVKAFATR